MASAQAMEEELQQSVMLSDEDAAYETADTVGEGSTIKAADLAQYKTPQSDRVSKGRSLHKTSYDSDASSHHNDSSNDLRAHQLLEKLRVATTGARVVDVREEDAEGDDDDDDDEGVGAVKFRPGDSSEDANSDSEVSDLPSAADNEFDEEDEDVAWKEANDQDEEEKSEIGQANLCVFCNQDEEHDPSEDYETYMVCRKCDDNGKKNVPDARRTIQTRY